MAGNTNPQNDPAGSDELSVLKDQFLASLNHEIRTPLSGILGMIDLLLETRLDEDQQEYAKAARLCAEALLDVLNATLEYSALSAGNLGLEEIEFPLRETLRSAVNEQLNKADAKGLRLHCTLAHDVPATAIGDAVRIRQILSHLIGNAMKFTNWGEVHVVASVEPGEADSFCLSVSVRDTGIGIPLDQLNLIFDSFRQIDSGLSRTYAGLGLGLALAQKLARLMHGEISAISDEGKGSTFSLRLPLRLPACPPAAAGGTSGRRRRILVVEDHDVSQRVVTHFLQRGSYAVDCVASGEEALEAASATRYDLVLMDLQMPGMDGLRATGELRRIAGYDRVPVVAFTANSSDEYRTLCREHGLQAFIAKPVQSDELLTTVARWIN